MNIAVSPPTNQRPAMYSYDDFDANFVRHRVAEFRDQVQRRLSGELSEEEFRPHRLMNGLYLQLHAYMLRIAIPYGTLSSAQLRQLAFIADKWDKGYGHFTTRQNIQFNWPQLKDVPDMLQALADVEMHAIQTSGNCIRNVTADHFAGVAADELEDPRPTAELLRQWSTAHPEYIYLPRKFKLAVTGASHDRSAMMLHDIGLRIVQQNGEIGYQVSVGGGLGRTPMVGKIVKNFLPRSDLLAYIAAIMSVYNRFGRRDNKYKARIKILVHETGIEAFQAEVEAEYAALDRSGTNADPEEYARIAAYFAPPLLDERAGIDIELEKARDPTFARFVENNVSAHKQPGYAIVTATCKPYGGIPGDVSSAQMRLLADAADRFSAHELRISHEQNVIFPYVRQKDLFELWQMLKMDALATPNAGLITDIIACPGMDYCTLATARSIPIAQDISRLFANEERQKLIGKLGIKISGCINACGHHHIASIGILGLEKSGKESFQITLGGDPTFSAAIGERLGPGLEAAEVPHVIDNLVNIYLELRQKDEAFIDTYRRVGQAPFKPALEREVEDGSDI